MGFEKIWIEQCLATRAIKRRFRMKDAPSFVCVSTCHVSRFGKLLECLECIRRVRERRPATHEHHYVHDL